jgi:phage FluMu protein Com
MEITVKVEGDLPDDFPVTCPKCGNVNRFKYNEITPGTVKNCAFCQMMFLKSEKLWTNYGMSSAVGAKAILALFLTK